MMSAFSNVGKLELNVRSLQTQMVKSMQISKLLQKSTETSKNELVNKAAKDQLVKLDLQKADQDYVKHLFDGLKARTDEVWERTNPEFLQKTINDNVSMNGVDELTSNLQQTMQNLEGVKKTMGDKASSAEVSAALQELQHSLHKVASDSLSRDDLELVLRDKVDKRELKKLATALSGIGGSASMTAGATKCIVCERPGVVHNKELIDAQNGSYDALDGYCGGGGGGGYDLPDVRPPAGGASRGPETQSGDNIDRYREEDAMLEDGETLSRFARMPPAGRMRTSVGGGVGVQKQIKLGVGNR